MTNKTKTRSLLLLLFLVAGFASVLLLGLASRQGGTEQSSIVKSFPVFSAPELLNPQKVLTPDVFSQPYQLVNVWASWCGVCKREHSFLLDLQKQGVAIIGLNYRDKKSAAVQYLQQAGSPYQSIIYDPKGALALDLGVVGTPETYLVDSEGQIIKKFSGELTLSAWQSSFSGYFTE